ncbi:MAG: MarR family transcriptional regulator [Clostridia bacterium]
MFIIIEQDEIDWDLMPIVLSKSLKIMNQKATKALKPYGLSSAHAMFLVVLSKNNGLTLRELSDILAVDKAQTTRIISDLKKKGYTCTDKENDCCRNYKIFLTEKGKKAAADITIALSVFRTNVMTPCIEGKEREIFLTTVSKIVNHIKTTDNILATSKEKGEIK